jgi:serine/threonine-protein kinase
VTGVGVLLGTAAYMSPEQARGRAVDKRADIWAFGVVLFEMLTGRRLFAGETVSDNLASVLRQEITWSALPAETPATVRRVLQRCLERDPRERLRDIGEARIALKEAPADEPISTSRPFARSLPWVLLVTVAVLAAAWNMWMQNGRGAAAPQVRELAVPYPAGVEPRTEIESAFAISRDGRSVALTGAKGIERRVFVRRLDSSEVVELDLLGVNSAAFSPDGTKIAVIGSDSGLTSISLADKLRVDIAPNADNVGQLTWGDAGVLFAHDGALWIAPSGGGEPRALTTLDSARHETLHTGPIFLPGGRTVLFASQTQVPGSERIEAVRVDGGARKVVVERATTPIWSPTGHLLFARDGAVLAASFDTETVRVEGEATPVFASGIVGTTRIGGLALRLAENGTLLFAPRDFHAQRMVLVARDGAATTLGMGLGRYELPRLSPNGRRLAFSMEGSLIGTWNLERRTREALTTAAPGTGWPVWTRDGSRIVYRRYSSLFWTSTDGSNMQGEVKETVSNDYPNAPGPNADSVLVTRIRAETSADVFLTSLSGSFSPRPLLESPAFEGGAQLSPDGRWLVYASTESGKFEIHVSRFPELDRKWLVSEGTGTHPRWSANGTEIYYRGPSMMTAVPFDGRGGEPLLGKPVWLFEDEYDLGNNTTTSNYDVTPGGQFMMIRRVAQGGYLRIVLNWTEELKRILAQARAR